MTTWKAVKFGDVVRQVKDKVDPKESGLERYIAGEHMETDNLHIRRWGTIGDNYLGLAFHMRFKPGQVLYGSRRTYLRKVAFADFEGITANTTYVLESKDPDVLLPELLPFIMQTDSFNEHSIKQSKGSVNPYINFSDIDWYEFPLP
jgi:type I restriction enzyme, S subunit